MPSTRKARHPLGFIGCFWASKQFTLETAVVLQI